MTVKKTRAAGPGDGGRGMKNLRLKSARSARDLSQQLAEAVGVSRQTINAIEKGDYNPTIGHLSCAGQDPG